MSSALSVSIGQYSDRGRKDANQDFHGAAAPEGSALAVKGVALALADGISTSPVSHLAAQIAVNSFLSDYYATSDAWTVERSVHRVVGATNAWLHAESRRSDSEDIDSGYVCTFSAVVLKTRTAHLFHVGDSQIARLSGAELEVLTQPHRVILSGRSYLSRALGIAPAMALDYRAVALAEGDVLVLTTDGVHEHVPPRAMAQIIHGADDLDEAARRVVEVALERGSDDNLTVQIVRVDRLPEPGAMDFLDAAGSLEPPPIPSAPGELDGYRLLAEIHANHRSHIYLAEEAGSRTRVALKVPAMDLRTDAELLRRFMMEEWIAARLDSPHLLKAASPARPRRALYVVTEHLEGVTLRQWMYDNPDPGLESVRRIIEQLVKGLRALHRNDIVHGDLRPENVMVDRDGGVKIIDFGSARVGGLAQAAAVDGGERPMGALQYMAPECLAGEAATWRSDLFSLGVIAYEMLSGGLPFGAAASRVRSRRDARGLDYVRARGVPAWIDGALRTAVHPDPARRHQALSEFVADLRIPNPAFTPDRFAPLAERDPVRFWQIVSLALALVCLVMMSRLAG